MRLLLEEQMMMTMNKNRGSDSCLDPELPCLSRRLKHWRTHFKSCFFFVSLYLFFEVAQIWGWVKAAVVIFPCNSMPDLIENLPFIIYTDTSLRNSAFITHSRGQVGQNEVY